MSKNTSWNLQVIIDTKNPAIQGNDNLLMFKFWTYIVSEQISPKKLFKMFYLKAQGAFAWNDSSFPWSSTRGNIIKTICIERHLSFLTLMTKSS